MVIHEPIHTMGSCQLSLHSSYCAVPQIIVTKGAGGTNNFVPASVLLWRTPQTVPICKAFAPELIIPWVLVELRKVNGENFRKRHNNWILQRIVIYIIGIVTCSCPNIRARIPEETASVSLFLAYLLVNDELFSTFVTNRNPSATAITTKVQAIRRFASTLAAFLMYLY